MESAWEANQRIIPARAGFTPGHAGPAAPAPDHPRSRGVYASAGTDGTMTTYFNGGISVDDLPEGNGWAIENLSLTTHSGTHLDAPYHF